MTDGSGTSAQITGLAASFSTTADEDELLYDELLIITLEFCDEKLLLDILELKLEEILDEETFNEDAVDATEERAKELIGVELQTEPRIKGISALAEPLLP